MSNPFLIDTTKTFPTLKNAPVVEASIRWEIESTKDVNRKDLYTIVHSLFSDCEIREQFDKPFSLVSRFMEVVPESKSPWCGFLIRDTKRRLNIDWRRDGLLVSQTAPYEGWQVFSPLAKEIWAEFSKVHMPVVIAEMGVRYLSSISISPEKRVSDFTPPPENPFEELGLDRVSFFAQDKLSISGGDYLAQSSRLLLDFKDPPALMVDIDVIRKKSTLMSGLDTALAEMRFIKNTIFFRVLPNAVKQFQ